MIRRGSNQLLPLPASADTSKLVRTFQVATGRSQYPTPLGKFEIVNKQLDPWWYPPAVRLGRRTRSRSRPGPATRSGTRWMGLSAPVRRHPRHARRRLDRLLRLARLHPDADPAGRVAVHAGRRGHAGVHRRGMTGPAQDSSARSSRSRLVAALLGLLVWKVASGTTPAQPASSRRASTRRAGVHARAGSTAPDGSSRSPTCEGKAGRRQLLGLVVHPVQGRGAGPRRQTYEQYRSQGLVVARDRRAGLQRDAKRFAKRYGVTYPIVYDDVNGSTLGKWGVTGFPETFFVDRPGRLVGERIQGGIDTERNKDGIRRGRRGSRSARRSDRARLAAVARWRWRSPLAGGARGGPARARPISRREIVCPTCKTTLDQSNSPIATRMKAFIRARIAAGDSAARDQGAARRPVRARRPRRAAEARVRPARLGCCRSPGSRVGAVAVGALAWTWSRRRETPGDGAGELPLDPELERRVDEELARFEG